MANVHNLGRPGAATYAHFVPDDDRAREIMNAFFAPTMAHVPSLCPVAAMSSILAGQGTAPQSRVK